MFVTELNATTVVNHTAIGTITVSYFPNKFVWLTAILRGEVETDVARIIFPLYYFSVSSRLFVGFVRFTLLSAKEQSKDMLWQRSTQLKIKKKYEESGVTMMGGPHSSTH